MRFYADLHVHSKYSRATSKDCDLEHLSLWGHKKGITVIGTGDFTHPAWFSEIKEKLVPAEPGLFRLRDDIEKEVVAKLPGSCHGITRFMLSVEISTIYKKGEKTRKIHHLIYAPTLKQVELINRKLDRIGNIKSDGRPILGLDSRHLLEIVLEAGEGCYLVPAHIWTPWFAVLGSKSGFDSIGECYGDLAEHIFAVETGLSSDPEMNWLISGLDRYRLVSNSDAHSPPKLGREACIFNTDLDYFSMRRALETGDGYDGSAEFFPEEGKYHLDGHRKCNIRLSPEESRQLGGICPACNKPLTLGVMHRVQELADRTAGETPETTDPFVSLVPLPEVIAETEGVGPNSKRVANEYEQLLHKLGAELGILSDIPLEEIRNLSNSSLIPEAIARMRKGDVIREAGYDGEYGRIKLFHEDELKQAPTISLFDAAQDATATRDNQRSGSPAKPPAAAQTALPRTDKPVVDIPTDTGLLDPDQQRALAIARRPLLIIAGPGSGKTRVLTHRIACLVENGTATPEQCLTVAFSRRAAGEMRERLRSLLPAQYTRIPILTFHALAYRILHENRVGAGLPRGFRISSEQERQQFLCENFGISERKAEKALKQIALQKRRGEQTEPGSETAAYRARLEEQQEIQGWLDYDDLMLLTLELLENEPGIAASYRKRYQWISIDEYQDIDPLQYRLIRLLSPAGENLCVIGDPDQSIYSFRGADVNFFLRFEQDFPGAQTLRLTRNYRSGQSIVSASTQMITPASLLENKQALALLEDTGRLIIHPARSDKAEAEFVVQSIEQMIGGISFFSLDSDRSDGERERDYSFSDFAVLYRTGAQADVIEEALERSGIPYQRHAHRYLSEHPQVQRLLEFMQGQDGNTSVRESLEEAIATLGTVEGNKDDTELEGLYKAIREIVDLCGDDREQFISQVHMSQEFDARDERADRCSLLTLHAAKGLEFPVVFIVGCEEGLLPLKWNDAPEKETLAEERRLFYVGMTRARDKLILSHAQKRFRHGRQSERKPSRFLQDIEKELLEIRESRYKKQKTQQASQMDLF